MVRNFGQPKRTKTAILKYSLPPDTSVNIYMENIQLTIADLMSLRQILDAACSRGSFKGNEMQHVGEIYNRLNAFVESVQLQAQAADQANAAGTKGEANA